jgi:hypothetical protein
MKVVLVQYVVVTYRQTREREGRRDVERSPVIHASVAKKPH